MNNLFWYTLSVLALLSIGYFVGEHYAEKTVVENVTEYSYIANQEDCIKRGGTYYLFTQGEEKDALSVLGRSEKCEMQEIDYTVNY